MDFVHSTAAISTGAMIGKNNMGRIASRALVLKDIAERTVPINANPTRDNTDTINIGIN